MLKWKELVWSLRRRKSTKNVIEKTRFLLNMNQRMFIFLSQFLLSSALICPVYPPNPTVAIGRRYIGNCQNNCSFQSVSDEDNGCIGIYRKSSGQILIKQLGVVASDDECSRSEHCNLEIDSLHPEVFCCCSTNNCTLSWTLISKIHSTTTRPASSSTATRFIRDQTIFSWPLLLSLFIVIIVVVMLTFAFVILKSIRHRRNENSQTKLRSSTSIENLFFSAQQSVLGKNSIIYKGHFHDQSVALKVYQSTHVLVWTNEMMLLKSIQHQSIIKILSDGQYRSHLYLVFPFYENGTLQSYLRTTHRTLPFHRCLIYLRSLASALNYLHMGKNKTGSIIVHRDIKSSNVLVADNGIDICLTDFGMATSLPRVLTEKDFLQIGTLRYMAPELLEGVISHTAEALCSVDMYALALVMWEIMSQCAAFLNTGDYRSPYDEYLTNATDRSSFTSQLYDLVVVKRLRPNLKWSIKDPQYVLAIQEINRLIDGCWTTDPDLRMNAQTLTLKLDQITE